MIVALIDNGSLEPAAHLKLRRAAAALSERVGVPVVPVSWKHSDRIQPEALDGGRAATLAQFVRSHVAVGEREFVFVPFFISPQGAIGSALRADLDTLQRELGPLNIAFTAGLATGDTLATIVTARVRETLALHARALPGFRSLPSVIIVDHGGPSPTSAAIRDAVAAQVRGALGGEVRAVAAASLEGADYSHNFPLLAEQLGAAGFDSGEVIIAPLFLAPGRHAGPNGDLARIAGAAEERMPELGTLASAGREPLRCHFTALVGTHPLAIERLAAALHETLSTFHASPFA